MVSTSPAAVQRANARRRNRDHIKRATLSDITAEQELAMRLRVRKCPLCRCFMTSKPNLPNSKHLDHIVPLNQGGTHTHGNVRIICADCNLHRPKDGSDYAGPVTLWAQLSVIVRPDRRTGNARTICKNGLHPWTPENISIVVVDGKTIRRCRMCKQATSARSWARRRSGGQQRPACPCGAPVAGTGGRTFLCPACTLATGQEAAELRATGQTWQQVAAAVGYTTAEGARFAAKRWLQTVTAA